MAEAVDLAKPFGKIKRQIALNQKRGDRESYYGGEWGEYGSGIASYEWALKGVLTGYLSDLLEDKKDPIVLDLMGTSKALSELSEQLPNKLNLGIAISLEDLRSANEKKKDASVNVVQMAGDILESSTWNRIEEQLQGRKADLIMERALDGFNCLPNDPRPFAVLLNNAWNLLSDNNGVIIFGVPDNFSSQAEKMVNKFKNNYKMDTLGGRDGDDAHYYIKIVKTPNSPKNLPFKDNK